MRVVSPGARVGRSGKRARNERKAVTERRNVFQVVEVLGILMRLAEEGTRINEVNRQLEGGKRGWLMVKKSGENDDKFLCVLCEPEPLRMSLVCTVL